MLQTVVPICTNFATADKHSIVLLRNTFPEMAEALQWQNDTVFWTSDEFELDDKLRH